MGRIKNMGTATMKFGEGVIVTGSAGSDTHSLVVTGTIAVIGDAYVDNIVLGFGDGDGKTITSGDDNLYIRFVDNTTAQFFAGKNVLELKEVASHHNVTINETGQPDVDFRVETNNLTHALFCDSGNEIITLMSDSEKTLGTDVNLFVSGTINSRGTGNRGTSVFGGDVVISGSLYSKHRDIRIDKFSKTGNYNSFYLKAEDSGNQSSPGATTWWIPPAEGRLISAHLRSNDAFGSTKITLVTTDAGDNPARTADDTHHNDIETQTVDCSAAKTNYAFNFTEGAIYTAEQAILLRVSGSAQPGDGIITTVWEYNFVS
jgi:hypothetical protein